MLGLLLIGLIWWLVAANAGDRDEVAEGATASPPPMTSPTPPADASAGAGTGSESAAAGETAGDTGEGMGGMTLAAVITDPTPHFGHAITTTATVVKPDSDRGFWLDVEGTQVLVVLAKSLDTPDPKTDINAGQKVRLTGTIHDASRASEVEELKPVTDETKTLLAGEKFFIRATDVTILEE